MISVFFSDDLHKISKQLTDILCDATIHDLNILFTRPIDGLPTLTTACVGFDPEAPESGLFIWVDGEKTPIKTVQDALDLIAEIQKA